MRYRIYLILTVMLLIFIPTALLADELKLPAHLEVDVKNLAGQQSLAANPYVIDAYPFIASNPSDPLHAAFAQCPTEGWKASTAVQAGGTKITDSNGNLEVVKTNGTTKSGVKPIWNTNYLGITADGTASWVNAGKGVVSASPCTVIATPGVYPVPSTLFVGIGGPNSTQELITFPGTKIQFTGNVKGAAGIVVGNKGSVIGLNSQNGGSVTGKSGTLDAVIESWSGFSNSALGMVNTSTPNMDVQGLYIGAGGAAVKKAVLWVAGVEGQGSFQNLSVALGGANQVAVLVDDTNQAWNALLFHNVWILGNHNTGLDGIGYQIDCGKYSQGQSISLQIVGGAIVDFAGTKPIWLNVNGSPKGSCGSVLDMGTYFETSNQSQNTGIAIKLNYASDFEAFGININGGPRLAQAVDISGDSRVHVEGKCFTNACGSGTQLINNHITNKVISGDGTFHYEYTPVAGKNVPTLFDGAKVQMP